MGVAPHALPAGYRLHWYEIREVLGQGGFGITYLAEDTNLGQPVAIKEYLVAAFAARRHDASVVPLSERHREDFVWGLQRFIQEGRTLAQFDHPAIVRVLSVFEANGTAYMVMRYEQGEPLAAVLERTRRLDEATLKRLLAELMDGLALVHAAGYIHRDIKPANIYLRLDGSPVLLDFGSARQALGSQTQTLTTVISPGYAPFEQYYSDAAPQGPWTDIYALGATLYRAIAGVAPLAAVDRSKTILAGKGDALVPAAEVGAGRYSAPFLAAVDHALAFREQDRPQSIAEWRHEILGGAVPEAPATQAPTAVTVPVDTGSVRRSPTTTSPAGAEPATAPTVPASAGAAVAPKCATAGTAGTARAGAAERRSRWLRRRWLRTAIAVALLLAAFAVLEPARTPAPPDPPEAPSARTAPAPDTPPPSPAVRAPPADEAIQALLAAAQADLAARRLTRPAGDSAFDKFAEVLRRDPGNAAARAGLEQIVDRYLRMARAAFERGDAARASTYVERAAGVLPEDPRIAAARARMTARPAEGMQAAPPAGESAAAALDRARRALERGDYREAARLLAPLAQGGDAEAQYRLGTLFALGRGVSQDYGRALELFRRAAEQGVPQAQHNLAMLLESGRGTTRDLAEARRWYREAARAGFSPARERLDALD